MDQLICASLSHSHCWYEVGMLKVPAIISGSRILCRQIPSFLSLGYAV